MKDKILILGAAGNLGSRLMRLLPNAIGYDRKDFDLTNFELAKVKLAEHGSQIKAIINCVAYNDVDGAETKPEVAELLNVKVPEFLAQQAKALNVPFYHFSTGYVFSGEKPSYSENDLPSPLSVYATTKAAGEAVVMQAWEKTYVIRINALFGFQGSSDSSKPSVVDIMKKIGEEKKFLRGITDEVNSFTFIPDLANEIVKFLTEEPAYGIYHVVNAGTGSWYDLAKEIFLAQGWQVQEGTQPADGSKTIVIEKIVGSQYPRPAKRPAYAVLENTKRPQLRFWQEALREYLAK